ncbi:hypothetical protein, partial [Microcoleus sp. Z1_B5]|uniref:hypothetical protein n=1 Tax=Microcoleus sp. Z1_B5 TaxID=3055430 RepID=UPI002FD73D8B
LDLSIDPTDKFGGSFIGYRFFISGRMNPGACILDAFGQSKIENRKSTDRILQRYTQSGSGA